MRTTLTLDDDVVIGLKRIQKKQPGVPFKRIVNQLMKKGLASEGEIVNVSFKVRPNYDAVPKPGLNFDCISELISLAEGDFHK